MKSSVRKLEYGKEYYERNKERIKEARRNRWKNAKAEDRERQRGWSREYYYRNAERSKSRTTEWMRNNKELVNARARLKRYIAAGLVEKIERETKLIEQLKAAKLDRTKS